MPNSDSKCDVVIVGAGMVGLTLANLLTKQGKSIAIIDQHEPARFASNQEYDARVTAVSPGSKAVFEYVNAWAPMQLKRVTPFTGMYVWEEASDANINFFAHELDEPNLGYIVENIVIQSSLHETLKQRDQVEWYFSSNVSGFNLSDSFIEIELSNQKKLIAKLLVGADGHRSSIRNYAQLGYSEKSYQQKGIVARVQTESPHQDIAWQRFLATGPLAFLPLSNRECSIVWSAHENYADELLSMNEEDFSNKISQASDYQLVRYLFVQSAHHFHSCQGKQIPWCNHESLLLEMLLMLFTRSRGKVQI